MADKFSPESNYHMKFGNNAGAHVDAYLEYKRYSLQLYLFFNNSYKYLLTK